MENLNDIKIKVISIATEQYNAWHLNKISVGNKLNKELISLGKLLRSTEEGRKILNELLDQPNLSVKEFAAYHLLPYSTEEAIKVLESLSKIQDDLFISSGAEILLSEWRSGNIKYDELNEDTSNDNVLNIYESIINNFKTLDIEKYLLSLSTIKKMVYGTIKFEQEVNNGGLNQYFWNTYGVDPQLAYDGYLLIGAKEMASLVKEANAIFIEELPENRKYMEEDTAESFIESYKHTELVNLDDKYHMIFEKEKPNELRNKYLELHKNSIDEELN